jgi:hypothetical protein
MEDQMFSFPLQAFSAIFSLLAGGFWMAAAYGYTVTMPWDVSRPVPESELAIHQRKWNARAALCAAIAAILQALTFIVQNYSVLIA